MKIKPLITVITATYNMVDTIERCITSVLEQEFEGGEEVEHIVIDGASTDGTPDVIEKFRDRIAYTVSEPDSGICEAWNKAIPHIKGEWVLFIGGDDFLHDPQALSRMAPTLYSAYPAHQIVYGGLVKVYQDGHRVLHKNSRPWDELKHEYELPIRKYPPHPSTFHHRSLFDSGKKFDTSYKYSADTLFLDPFLNENEPLFVDSMVTCFSMGGQSNSDEKELERWFENDRMRRELNLDIPFFRRILNFLKVYVKHILIKAGLMD